MSHRDQNDKDIEKDGFQHGGLDTSELRNGSRQLWSHLNDKKISYNSYNVHPVGRTGPLDQFSCGAFPSDDSDHNFRRDDCHLKRADKDNETRQNVCCTTSK